jgi:hypothetical protein
VKACTRNPVESAGFNVTANDPGQRKRGIKSATEDSAAQGSVRWRFRLESPASIVG